MAFLGLEDLHLPSLDPLEEDDWLGALDISQPVQCPSAAHTSPRPHPSQTTSRPVPIGRGTAPSLGAPPRKTDYSSMESTQTILGSASCEDTLLGAASTTLDDSEEYADGCLLPPSPSPHSSDPSLTQLYTSGAHQRPLLDLDDLLLEQRPSFLCDHDHDLDALPADTWTALQYPQYHSGHPLLQGQQQQQPPRNTQPSSCLAAPAWGSHVPSMHSAEQQLLWLEDQGSAAHLTQHFASQGDPTGSLLGGQHSAQHAALEQCVHKGMPAFMQVHPAMVGGYHHPSHLVDAHGLPGLGAEREEERQEGDSEGATEDSDITMHPAASLLGTPTSPKFCYLEAHTKVHEKGASASPRGAPALRRVSSARSTGAAPRSPARLRLQVVMKHQPQHSLHSAQHAQQPWEGTAGIGRRPRRAAALRSLAGRGGAAYGGAYYDGGDEEYDAQAEEGGYGSGGEGLHSPLARSMSGGGGPLQALPGAAVQPVGKKKHNPWSVEETEALIEGVHLVGVGKWAEIKKLPLAAVSGVLLTRSAVDLKDKWRNLTRVARLPKSALKSRLAKGGSDTPLELVLAVKEILESGRAEQREWR